MSFLTKIGVRSEDRAALCATALNEGPYIAEWITYHLHLGFDHIYIYDNSFTFDLKEQLRDDWRGRVTLIPWHATGQEKAYDHCLKEIGHSYRWLAVLDCDEFIVLKRHGDIKEMLRDHCSSGALALNWVLFGSNSHIHAKREPVTRRFIRRQIGVDLHVKCIACVRDVEKYVSSHYPNLKGGDIHDTRGTVILGPFNEKGTDEVACIHHYFTKSEDEFKIKMARGYRTFGNPTERTWQDFLFHDRNDQVDAAAWHFYRRIPSVWQERQRLAAEARRQKRLP